ncbi:MAG: sortase-like acyltransferase [Chlorobi bacterium]|nr:sortase-like acyltransferase [Chlorobiota bacterium]
MNIRFHDPADADEWLRLRCALWPESSPETHRAEMNAWLALPDAIVLVAARPDGGRLAGFAEVGTRSVVDGCDTSPVAYLEGWYVDADARRRGVGAALVHAAEDWAREKGFREFASDVELENVLSQQAHVALGFTETGRSVLYMKTL